MSRKTTGDPLLRSPRRLRAQSEVVGAVLAVAALFMVFMFTFNYLNIAQQNAAHSYALKKDVEIQKQAEMLTATKNGNQLCLTNNGTIPVTIVRLWIKTPTNDIVVRKPGDLGVNEPFTITPGETKCIQVDGVVTSIVTSRGNIFTARQLGLPESNQYGGGSGGIVQVIGGGLIIGPGLFTPGGVINSSSVAYDQNLLNEPTYSNIASGKAYGMVRYRSGGRGGFILVADRENTVVRFSSGGTLADIGNVFIAYQPGSKSKYNILITGPGDDSVSYWRHKKKCRCCWFFKKWCCEHEARRGWHRPTIELNGFSMTLGEGLGATGWRIRIIGFRPYSFALQYSDTLFGTGTSFWTNDIRKALGYWWYYGGTTDYDRDYGDDRQVHARLYLYGYADRVEVYVENYGVPRTSYRPYIITGDYDGDGLPELVFTTEDTYPGGFMWHRSQPSHWVCSICGYDGKCRDDFWITWSSTADDAGRYMDYSERPFIMYFTRYPIDPSKHGMVEMTVGVYFHQSDFCTGCQDRNKPVLSFLLVDPGPDNRTGTSDDRIVSSYVLTYNKLSELQSSTGMAFLRTYPPPKGLAELKIRMLLTNVHTEGRKVYFAIAFGDPYGGWVTNDAEMTIVVEPITLTFYAKG